MYKYYALIMNGGSFEGTPYAGSTIRKDDIELVNFNEKKGTTVIKWKDGTISKVKVQLDKGDVYFEDDFNNSCGLAYPNRENCICSAIEHDGSYGRTEDKVEIMGLLTKEEGKYDSVLGWLNAEDVFTRIEKHYKESKNENL